MSTNLRSETEVIAFLEEALSHEISCEFSGHPDNKRVHDDGGATWVVVTNCKNCGENTTLSCQKFCALLIRSLTDDSIGKAEMTCSGCMYSRPFQESYKRHFRWG